MDDILFFINGLLLIINYKYTKYKENVEKSFKI